MNELFQKKLIKYIQENTRKHVGEKTLYIIDDLPEFSESIWKYFNIKKNER